MNRKKLEEKKKMIAKIQESQFLREEYIKLIRNLKKIYNNGEIILDNIAVEKLSIYLSTKNIKTLLH